MAMRKVSMFDAFSISSIHKILIKPNIHDFNSELVFIVTCIVILILNYLSSE